MIETASSLRIGVDVGGTFTDLVIEAPGEPPILTKRATTPSDPLIGLLDVIDAAAAGRGTSRRQLLGETSMIVHGTTRATNAVATAQAARTALFCTMGHPDTLLWREGNDRRRAMDFTQSYPAPYVPRRLTFEIRERVAFDGSVLVPLDEAGTRELLRQLDALDVEAIAVALLWSIANPRHELGVGALIEDVLPGVPFTLSHALNPTLREYRRTSSAAIDASVKPLMTRYFERLEDVLHSEGFNGKLLSLTSAGGVLDAADVAAAPIHSIGSGPAAAPVAGRHIARRDASADLVIVTDAGGTTYDVSVIDRGVIPWARDMVVGDPPGHLLGFPAVDVRCVTTGGGSIARVDSGGLLHVGPTSAGADPGPACYGRDGARVTVTDACIVLGHIDPDRFLGGALRVDGELAAAAIERDAAEPLGIDVDDAAFAVYALAVEQMAEGVEQMTVEQGLNHEQAVMIAGGGGGGLYAAFVGLRLGIARVVVPETAAALSATGALLGELRQSFSSVHVTSTGDFDHEGVNQLLTDLTRRCRAFLEGAGSDPADWIIELSVEGRYPEQVWELEVALPTDRFEDATDVAALHERFHEAHERRFAHRDAGADVQLVSWTSVARCRIRDAEAPYAADGPDGDIPGSTWRSARLGPRRERVAIFDAAALATDFPVTGPAVVEASAQSVIVPAGTSLTRLRSGALLIECHGRIGGAAE